MRGAHVRIVVLRKWFPPDDPLAAKIARLCILREDLLIEMHGVYTESITELDGLSEQYRRMYFLRNLMRSQMELSGAIQVLLRTPEFSALLEKQSDEVKKKFTEVVSVLNRVHPLLKDVRNDIGGHVLESAVQSAGAAGLGILRLPGHRTARKLDSLQVCWRTCGRDAVERRFC